MNFQQGPRSVLAALAVALGATGAHAGDPPAWPSVPPPEAGDAIVHSRLIVNDTAVEMVDAATGQTIIGQGTNVTIWDDCNTHSAVQPTIQLNPQPTGFDLVYTFTNDSPAPKTMGRLRVGSMLLGSQMTWQDFTYLGEDRPSTSDNWTIITRNYPASWYSPVAVFRNADYAVGVSLLYPMMEYKHDVRVCVSNNGVPGRGHEGWEAIFQLQNFGDEGRYDRLGYQHDLAPGETRTYVLAVRVTKNSDDWLRTLLPYRDFFLKFYGGVRYARNTEPVIGFTTGITSYVTQENPYGFGSWRPDLHGWDTFTAGLRTLPGWKNVMIWKPTGHYRQHPAGNMPFQFTSRWLADPELATATDPTTGFPSIVSAGKNLGLWWGHSASVSRAWDDGVGEPLNPDNPDHVRLALAELDLAVQAGATMIGLDTFHPWSDAPWNLTRWVQVMQARYPQVRFVAEPISFDILHSLVPGFMQGFLSGGNPRTLDDLYPLKQPHMLANFFLPGNEIWTSFTYGPHEYYLHITPTDQMVNDDIARYARLGFTPIMFPPITVNLQNRDDQKAAEAWKQVVPPDLLDSYHWNRNYVNGSIIRRLDGTMAIIEASSPEAPPSAPPVPAPPPPAPPQGQDEPGGGGGGMVMGSVPDPVRHAARTARKSATAKPGVNLAEAVPDQISSTQGSAPASTTAGAPKLGVNSSAPGAMAGPGQAPRFVAKPDAPARTPDAGGPSSSAGSGGAFSLIGTARSAPISVVPSSTPSMSRRLSASRPVQLVGPRSGLDQSLTLNAVRQALLRAQMSRPSTSAGVVEVER
jgi:hypothetical protein